MWHSFHYPDSSTRRQCLGLLVFPLPQARDSPRGVGLTKGKFQVKQTSPAAAPGGARGTRDQRTLRYRHLVTLPGHHPPGRPISSL